uniref:C-type lectin domain-containing protein n=1 Tax=Oryzias latipes TaxID=8090 RepID=A0A3P9JES2_ORYLA
GAVLNVSFAQIRQFYFVNTPLNWANAQSVCRQNYTDLATIENTADVDAAIVALSSLTVWIGLYRQRVWSDGSQSVFQYNIVVQQGSTGEKCISVEKPGQWSNNDCSSQFPFICYKTGMYVQVLH